MNKAVTLGDAVMAVGHLDFVFRIISAKLLAVNTGFQFSLYANEITTNLRSDSGAGPRCVRQAETPSTKNPYPVLTKHQQRVAALF